MNALQKKLSVATLLVGTILGTINLPSLAYDNCGWNPAQNQVMRRDNYLGREIRGDRGFLNGNFNRLANEDRSIRFQAQREAAFNGGYLTRGEQRQLNREENRLQRQVNFDNRWY